MLTNLSVIITDNTLEGKNVQLPAMIYSHDTINNIDKCYVITLNNTKGVQYRLLSVVSVVIDSYHNPLWRCYGTVRCYRQYSLSIVGINRLQSKC